MGYALFLIGLVVLFCACSIKAENSIHQIYVQLQYLTAAVCIGLGQIIIIANNVSKKVILDQTLNSIKEELKSINTKLTDNKETIQQPENESQKEEESL